VPITTVRTVSDAASPAPSGSLRRTRPRYGEAIIRAVLLCATLLSVATTAGIIYSFIPPTVQFFREVGVVEFFTTTVWAPLFTPASYGVLPLVAGTVVVTVIAVAVAIPLGLGAAMYLSEYAGDRARRVLKPILEILAGIPTVVYGFFAFTAVTPALRAIWPVGDGPAIFNGLSAGLVIGVMIIPTVASLSEDAMSAVPRGLREGAFALGSSRRQVATRVVLPAALSGVVSAFVLGVSRAIGETMIVLIASGAQPTFTLDPTKAMETMTAFIAAAGSGDIPVDSTAYRTVFAVGSLLFVVTFLMNMMSIRLVRRFREVYE
jgi:phosphate transport system permease protein